ENVTDTGIGLQELQKVGIGLIIGGCIAFAVSSFSILFGHGLLGFPDTVIAGALLTLTIVTVAALMPELGDRSSEVRAGLGYLAAFALAGTMAASIGTAHKTPVAEVPVAFGFSVFNYLLFMAVAHFMSRRKEGVGPASALLIANSVVHVLMVYTALGSF